MYLFFFRINPKGLIFIKKIVIQVANGTIGEF